MWSPIWRVLLVFQNTLFSYLDLTRTLWNCVTGISLYFTHEETEARMWMMCPYCLTQGLHQFILAFIVYNDSLFLTSSPAFVLCHTTLLNLFISSERFFLFFFFLHSLGFSMYEIMSSANRDNFTSAFLVWILSFSCLISLAIPSRTVLNSSG